MTTLPPSVWTGNERSTVSERESESPGGDAEPSITVVITAHDRARYLVSCVDSIIAQAPSNKEVEIIVVKNFVNPELDSELEALGVRVMLVTSVNSGAKLARAIEASSSSLIAFLEDDDLFMPGKLTRVLDAFSKHPNLGYYHNGACLIDERGNPFLPSRLYQKLPDTGGGNVFVDSPGDTPHLLASVRLWPHHNCSSITIRRVLLTPNLDLLQQIYLIPDQFLFFCWLVSDTGMLAESEPLTAIRVHSGGASTHVQPDGMSGLQSMGAFSLANGASVQAIAALANRAGRAPALDSAIALQIAESSLLSLRTGSITRRLAWGSATRLFRLRRSYVARSRRDQLAALGLAALSPRVARWVYGTFKTLGY